MRSVLTPPVRSSQTLQSCSRTRGFTWWQSTGRASGSRRCYRLASLVSILHELIDDLELDRPVVMGHSWGGAIGVRYAAAHPDDVRALVLLDSGHIDYRDLPDVDPDRPVEEWVAEVEAREDPRRAEARGRAMSGLTDRVSDAWPVLTEQATPTLLFLATEPPHVHENRKHIARFETAVPHADVRWPERAGHGILADVGPPLGDAIATWLVEQGL
jgi:pimeloyl-ACP methyl ester carboxylesterase